VFNVYGSAALRGC